MPYKYEPLFVIFRILIDHLGWDGDDLFLSFVERYECSSISCSPKGLVFKILVEEWLLVEAFSIKLSKECSVGCPDGLVVSLHLLELDLIDLLGILDGLSLMQEEVNGSLEFAIEVFRGDLLLFWRHLDGSVKSLSVTVVTGVFGLSLSKTKAPGSRLLDIAPSTGLDSANGVGVIEAGLARNEGKSP